MGERLHELKGRGLSILLTTHHMEEAARLCDRVAIMDRGKILVEGKPADLVRAQAGALSRSESCNEWRHTETMTGHTPRWRRGARTSPTGMADILVIGGGAAGFMAAVSAAETLGAAPSIRILERGEPLAKVRLSGGGRCNLTNATFELAELEANYPRGGKFLLSAFSRFGPRETMDWFESRGVHLKIEAEGKVYPASDDSGEIIRLFLGLARQRSIIIDSHSPVTEIRRAGDRFLVKMSTATVGSRRIILATGGDPRRAAPSGYDLAASLGHTITPLTPSLTGLLVLEPWAARLAGVSVRGAVAAAFHDHKAAGSAEGDFVFTHRGISGPLAYRLSSRCAYVDYRRDLPLEVRIDFMPGVSREELEGDLMARIADHPRRGAATLIGAHMPRALAEALLEASGIDPAGSAGRISRRARCVLVGLLKEALLTVTGRDPRGEVVTAGGVSLDEVDQRTMASKRTPGLYLAGEVLDVDGFTGGFNLQAAWSTGRLAGRAAAASLNA